MLVLIDETGLPPAKLYYNMFPFEPSRRREDDIVFSHADMHFLKHPTLVDVMKAMVAAAEKGEKEVMLVAHGNADGLVMKIAPHIPFSADLSDLKWLPVAAEAFDVIDTSQDKPKNMSLLNAWARVGALLEAQADESRVPDIITRIVAEQLASASSDVARACIELGKRVKHLLIEAHHGLVKNLKTTEHALREAATLTTQVKNAAFSRFELRACSIGSGPGIQALRTFFNVTRLMAPTVHTFYVSVIAPDTPSAALEMLAKTAGPRWRSFKSESFQVPLEKSRLPPFAKPFFDPPQAYVTGSINFMLNVTPIRTPRYMTEARRLNAKAAVDWVKKYIHPSAVYSGRGHLMAAGLDSPTPDMEPYTLPQDPNYRSLIAVATVTGVEK